MAIGLTMPLARATGSLGFIAVTNTELEATRENLRSLLLTNRGERLHMYSFGCSLLDFAFEQQSPSLKQQIADRINAQVAFWLPYVSIKRLNILFDQDDPSVQSNVIRINIEFFLTRRPDQTAILSQDVAQAGTG